MNPTLAPYILFGSTKPWLPPPWTTTDDRVRGGASQSYLSALPDNCAKFHGHLDTSTLGGAGFASQFSPPPQVAGTGKDDDECEEGSWDLSGYDGIEVEVGKGDGKAYTLILKDEGAAGKREDGREKAGVNWEVDLRVGEADGIGEKEGVDDVTKIWVPWGEFKATFRGKEKNDAGELKKGEIRRIGLMMRSYFGKQEGDFSVVLRSVCARKTVAGDVQKNASNAVGRLQGSMPEDTDAAIQRPRGSGWFDWFSGRCTVS